MEAKPSDTLSSNFWFNVSIEPSEFQLNIIETLAAYECEVINMHHPDNFIGRRTRWESIRMQNVVYLM